MEQILSFRATTAWTFILFALSIPFNAGAFSMFSSSKNKLPQEWAERFSNGASLTEYGIDNKINLNDFLIDGARINKATLSDFNFTKIDFKNFGGEETKLINGSFKNCSFSDATFDRAILENITFDNCKFFDTTFVSAMLKNIKFINCEISNSALFHLKDSDIEFINTKIFDNEYKFSDSHIKMRLIDSELKNTDIRSLKEGSSIYMDNSKIHNVNFTRSNLLFFKAINSKITNSSAGSAQIEDFTIQNSEVKFSFGKL